MSGNVMESRRIM